MQRPEGRKSLAYWEKGKKVSVAGSDRGSWEAAGGEIKKETGVPS